MAFEVEIVLLHAHWAKRNAGKGTPANRSKNNDYRSILELLTSKLIDDGILSGNATIKVKGGFFCNFVNIKIRR